MKPEDAKRAAEFISRVWKITGSGYGAIQEKSDRGMQEHFFEVPGQLGMVEGVLRRIENRDIYFCPLPGRLMTRKRGSFMNKRKFHCRLLWADLDEVNPRQTNGLKPTIAWETSPGRYQSLWVLDKDLPIKKIEEINRSLTYTLGADKGGWDLGQILRVPYTHNLKPKYNRPQVKLMWFSEKSFPSKKLKTLKLSKKIEAGPRTNSAMGPPLKMSSKLEVAWRKWEKIPEGERSEWPNKWAWSLLSQGLNPQLVIEQVSRHPLTVKKFGDKAESDLIRIVKKWEKEGKPKRGKDEEEWNPTPLPINHLISKEYTVPWIVEGMWPKHSVGIMAGDPKTYKTWVSFDLAVSAAAGTPWLGSPQFKAKGGTRTLIVQEEDPEPLIASRMRRIMGSKGIGPQVKNVTKRGLTFIPEKDIPLWILCQTGFTLSSGECLEKLEEIIRDERIEFVILDPLFMMMGDVDEFKAGQMINILRPLKTMRNLYGTSFLVVHHNRKPSKENGGGDRGLGDNMYGSFVLKAWLESGIHLAAHKEVQKSRTILIQRQFKSAPPGNDFYVKFPPMDEEYLPQVMTRDQVKDKDTEEKNLRSEEERLYKMLTVIRENPGCNKSLLMNELSWGDKTVKRFIELGVEKKIWIVKGGRGGIQIFASD